MIYGVGRLTVAQLQRREVSAENESSVEATVTGTSLLTLNLGVLTAGDRVFLWAFANGDKLLGAGGIDLEFAQASGTATGLFSHDQTNLFVSEPDIPAETLYARTLEGMMRVTVGGTYVLDVIGYSRGSDWRCGSGNVQAYAWVWPAA